MYTTLLISLFFIACPIDGQIRKRYPTYSCDRYCDDPEDKVCDLISREYGCECPDGMIINKAMNKCVYPRDCPGMYVILYSCITKNSMVVTMVVAVAHPSGQ